MAGLLDNYMAQVQDYKKAGSIGSGLLPDRPNLELGQQGLLGQMQAAESEYLKRVSDPLPYYQKNPEAQGLLNVSPELDLIDLATGGGKMAMVAAARNMGKKAGSGLLDDIIKLYKTDPLGARKIAKRNGLLDEIGDQMPRPRGDISNAGELRAKANSDRFADTEYQGQHGAPMAEDNAPLHDLSQVYPSDIYSSKGLQYYGTGNKSIDAESMKAIQSFKGKPDKQITMYRAIPDDIGDVDINAGDWVSLSKQYAKDHGESALNGNYKIISKKAPARQLFTNGDSINEFGFDPSVAK